MNEDPEAIKFANEWFRRMAELLVGTYEAIEQYKAEWDARPALRAKFPAGSGVVLNDGHLTDGRPPVTNSNVEQLPIAMDAIKASMDAVQGGAQRIVWLRRFAAGGRINLPVIQG